MTWLGDLLGKGARYIALPATTTSRTAGPDTLSGDAASMCEKWRLIADVMEGNDAIKEAGVRYLPRFGRELIEKYKRRLADAPWRPIFPAAIESITSRPFAKPVTVEGKPSERMKRIASDVDALGNNLNVFARRIFNDGVTFGLSAIFVDYTRVVPRADGKRLTLAEEKLQGARPYWLQIAPQDLIDVRTDMRNGKLVIVHARWRECTMAYDGFAESRVQRVRVYELDAKSQPHWQLWEKQTEGGYVVVSEGDLVGMNEIPLALFFTGKRKGTFAVKPPLYDLAIVALEHYRAMARTTEIENFSGWPTLVGVGMSAPDPLANSNRNGDALEPANLEIGPGVTLFAPPAGSDGKTDWKIIGPDAALVAEVAKSPERVMDEFRRLAMEPMVQKSGNVTATASAIDNSRAHSAVEAWAGALKDCLDQALRFTAMWLNEPDQVTANVATDFIAMVGNVDEAKVLADAQKRGVISAKTERAELKRRSILAPDWDESLEEEQLAFELEGLNPEDNIDPVSGHVIPFGKGSGMKRDQERERRASNRLSARTAGELRDATFPLARAGR